MENSGWVLFLLFVWWFRINIIVYGFCFFKADTIWHLICSILTSIYLGYDGPKKIKEEVAASLLLNLETLPRKKIHIVWLWLLQIPTKLDYYWFLLFSLMKSCFLCLQYEISLISNKNQRDSFFMGWDWDGMLFLHAWAFLPHVSSANFLAQFGSSQIRTLSNNDPDFTWKKVDTYT